MTETSHVATMRRLTRGGRPPRAFGDISPAKAMRLAIAKSGQDVLSQPIMGSGLEELQAPVQKLAEVLPNDPMCMLTRGPEEATGLAVLDRSAVFAVTEALTKGLISDATPSERPLTTTDGFLCQEFLQLILTMFHKRLESQPSANWAGAFETDDMIQDLRRLPLLMRDVAYRVMTMDCDFGGGAKIGQVVLVYPWEGPNMGTEMEDPVAEQETQDEFQSRMLKALKPVELELTAVLTTYDMTMSQLLALKPGDTLHISRRRIESIEIRDENGKIFAVGQYGDFMGEQAVRLTSLADGTVLKDDDGIGSASQPEPDPGALMESQLSNALTSAPAMMGDDMLDIPPPPETPDFDPDNLELPDLDLEAPYPDGEIPGLAIPGEDDGEDMAAPLDLGDLSMESFEDLPEAIE